MKKILFILVLLISFPLASAIDFEMNSNFSKGETLMAKISGEFIQQPIQENIFFYRRHMPTSLIPYISKIGNDFYIYLQIPLEKIPDNYSIVIKNTEYYLPNGKTSSENLIKNFTILNNTADFSISPGFIVTNKNFSIEIKNLKDYEIEIQINPEEQEEQQGFFASLFGNSQTQEINSITLKSGETKKINFEIENQTFFKTIKLKSENTTYEIPVYEIVENQNFTEEQIPKEQGFYFDSLNLNISLSINSSTTRIVYLKNTGEKTLENINLSLSDSLKENINLSIYEILELKENKTKKIILNISSDRDEKIISGQLIAKTENLLDSLEISLNFIKDYVPVEEEQENKTLDEPLSSKTCEEINGTFCKDNEKCNISIEYAKDGKCCLGKCEEVKKNSKGKLIGWIILIVLVLLFAWFYFKKYKYKKDINLFEIAKGKNK